MEPRNLLRKYQRLIKLAKVPYMPFYNLRHTHATILMRMGENPKVVSERLGHARVGITLDIYSHTNEKCRSGQRIGLVNILDLMEIMEAAEPLGKTGLVLCRVQLLCSICAMYKNTGEIGFLLKNRKKTQTLDTHGLKPSQKV